MQIDSGVIEKAFREVGYPYIFHFCEGCGFLFSVEKKFSEGKYSIQYSALFFFVLKLPITRRFYCRAISTLNNTNLWASPRLGSQRWLVQFSLSAIISTYFKILVNPFLCFDTKKQGFFSTKFRVFWDVGSIFLENSSFSDLTEANRHFSILLKKLGKPFLIYQKAGKG